MDFGHVREIRKNSTDSHQIAPGYVLTFVRWSNRSTYNYTQTGDLNTRNPLVVYNDAVEVSVTNTKAELASTMSATLKGGDINYSTAIHPGDYVLVNMLNWETDAERVASKASNQQPINEIGDGFKGVFKIQNVVRDITVNPSTGIKTVNYIVTASAFTEFNNIMYYNPAIAASFREQGAFLWNAAIGDFWQDFLKTNSDVQKILKALFQILIGQNRKKVDTKVPNYGNTQFNVPTLLGKLLNRPKARFATEIYNYILGVWENVRSSSTTVSDRNISGSFNPGITAEPEGNFFKTKIPLQGNKEVSLDNWNQNTAWSILQGYLNSTLNEMYTTFRVSPNSNYVLPTVVVRQKPFTTPHFFAKRHQNVPGFPLTVFTGLPRWRISADLLMNIKTTKNDAARFNFVQVFTRSLSDVAEQDTAQQVALENFVIDDGDIKRNGLRPYIQTSNFDFPREKDAGPAKRIRAKEWSRILSDWIIDGHLKESGVATFVGIQDPISVGDNLEFDNIIYHIESIVHSMRVAPSGHKMFRTKVTLSYGMDKRSSKNGPVYAEMDHTDAHTKNLEDYNHERILPGISDTQDIAGTRRKFKGEEVVETRQESFTPRSLRTTRKATSEKNTGTDRKHSKDDGGSGQGTTE